MLEVGLFALLSTAPTLTSLEGANVFPILLPEGVLPATTYQVVGGSADPTFSSSGLQKWRLQLDHFAADAIIAYQIRNAAIALLNGWRGNLPGGPFAEILFIQPIDHFENDARQFRCTSEFYVFFSL